MSRTRQKHKRTTSPFRQGGPKPPPAQRTHRGSSKAEKEKDRERGGHHLARGTGAGPGPAMSVPSTASMRRWSRSPDGPEGSAARRARANERRQQTSSCASGWGAPAGGVRQRGGEGRGAGLRRQRGRERGYGKGLPTLLLLLLLRHCSRRCSRPYRQSHRLPPGCCRRRGKPRRNDIVAQRLQPKCTHGTAEFFFLPVHVTTT